MQINIPRLQNDAQKVMAEKLSVIVNEIGMKLIKVYQVSRELKGFGGIADISYFKRSERSLGQDSTGNFQTTAQNDVTWRTSASGNFTYAFIGGSVRFDEDPFPESLVAGTTGKVVYMVLDDLATPKGSKSGELKGYNLEFLASQYDQKLFKIADPDIEAQVISRRKRIEVALKPELKEREKIKEFMAERSSVIEAQMRGETIVKQSSGDATLVQKLLEKVEQLTIDLANAKAGIVEQVEEENVAPAPAPEPEKGPLTGLSMPPPLNIPDFSRKRE